MGQVFVFDIPLTEVYALGLFMTAIGLRDTYLAWTGQTDRLTIVLKGIFEERRDTRRSL